MIKYVLTIWPGLIIIGIGGGEYFQLPKDGKSTKVTQNNGYKSVLNSKNTEESWVSTNSASFSPSTKCHHGIKASNIFTS